MSENVDLVRSIYAAWERGDWRSAEWAHPQFELNIADGPEPDIWIGRAAMAESWQRYLNAWEDYRIEAEEFRELDDERVLVLNHYTGRRRTSGLEIGETGTKPAAIFHVRDGKVTRLVGYNDRERAFADLGLAE